MKQKLENGVYGVFVIKFKEIINESNSDVNAKVYLQGEALMNFVTNGTMYYFADSTTMNTTYTSTVNGRLLVYRTEAARNSKDESKLVSSLCGDVLYGGRFIYLDIGTTFSYSEEYSDPDNAMPTLKLKSNYDREYVAADNLNIKVYDSYIDTDSEGVVISQWYKGTGTGKITISDPPKEAGKYTVRLISMPTATHKMAIYEEVITVVSIYDYITRFDQYEVDSATEITLEAGETIVIVVQNNGEYDSEELRIRYGSDHAVDEAEVFYDGTMRDSSVIYYRRNDMAVPFYFMSEATVKPGETAYFIITVSEATTITFYTAEYSYLR